MLIKSFVAGVAFALAASVGSATAADEFTTLDGVAADVMSATELSAAVGSGIVIVIGVDGFGEAGRLDTGILVGVPFAMMNGNIDVVAVPSGPGEDPPTVTTVIPQF